MRFEIGPGGMFVILLGLIGLSGAVFGLGLIAGHELAGSEPGAQPVAAAFPLPAAPGAPAPAVAAAAPPPVPVPVATAPSAPGTAADSDQPKPASAAANPPASPAVTSGRLPEMTGPAAPADAAAHKVAKTAVAARERPSTAADASDDDLTPGMAVAPPSKAGSAAAKSAGNNAEDEDEDNAESAPAPVAPPPPAHKKMAALDNPPPTNPQQPYSIQIDAVMDRQGARQMVQKLRAKGFQPYLVPTQVAGKTWYRLRVGHYATPAEAQAAEAKLHQEFNDTPAGH